MQPDRAKLEDLLRPIPTTVAFCAYHIWMRLPTSIGLRMKWMLRRAGDWAHREGVRAHLAKGDTDA